MGEGAYTSNLSRARSTLRIRIFEALPLAMTNQSAAHNPPELIDSVMSRNTVSLDLPVALSSSLHFPLLRATLFFSSAYIMLHGDTN
jgi:hypothetical protein